MDSISLAEFKNRFEEQKAKLVMPFRAASEYFTVDQDEIYDDGDLTACELASSMRIRLKNREALFLKKINQALSRISDGTYGFCGGCGEEIELRRLEARPTATHCVTCKEDQERLEHAHIDGRRHKSLGTKLSLA